MCKDCSPAVRCTTIAWILRAKMRRLRQSWRCQVFTAIFWKFVRVCVVYVCVCVQKFCKRYNSMKPLQSHINEHPSGGRPGGRDVSSGGLSKALKTRFKDYCRTCGYVSRRPHSTSHPFLFVKATHTHTHTHQVCLLPFVTNVCRSSRSSEHIMRFP